MAAAETARLIASLELQDKNFTRGIKNVERGIGRVDKKLSAFGGFVNRNLARGIDRAAASLVDGVFAGVESLQELEKAQAQTNAVIKSTGGIAGVSGDEVTKLAEKYESLNAIVGDEFIRSGQNMLLTFTNINKKAFEPALAVALDLNTAMGKGPEGLTSTVIQVGKALNDPTKGLTALRKVGVSFTKDQVKLIKSLQESGDLYGAQQIILKELNKEFGGSFAAQGDTTAGKVAKFNDAVEDLQRTFAKALLPIISKVADKLGTFLGDPAVVAAIEDAGIALGQAFDGVLAAAEKINWGAIAGGLKSAAGFAGELVGWFGKFPDWAQALIVGGFVATKLPIVGDIFSEAAKGLIKGVLGINAGTVIVKGGLVTGGPGAPVPGGGGGGLLGAVKTFAIPVAIASITIAAAKVLTDAIEPGFQEHLDRGDKPLANRDPRRFDKEGRVQTNWLSKIEGNTRVGGVGDRPSPGNPGLTRAIIELKKGFATGQRPHGPPPLASRELAVKAQATINAIKNAQSIATREASAQAAELANIKNGMATLDTSVKSVKTGVTDLFNPTVKLDPSQVQDARSRSAEQKAELQNIKNASVTLNTTTTTGLQNINTTTLTGNTAAAFHSAANVIATGSTTTAVNTNAAATRLVAPPIISQLSATGASIVAAIWAARPVIQSTNVVNNYTTKQRTGSTTGSRNGYVRAPGAG